jgi:aspartate kinase
MALFVKKFGGSSVRDLSCIEAVAEKIKKVHDAGDKLVIVVSAMAGDTDRLDALAHQVTSEPDPRELDALLATGEQISISLLAMALKARGCDARSYTGAQVRIKTDSAYNKARILDVETDSLLQDLADGRVVIVAGFQGVDALGNITTLGRGGSDTTAVALAAALKADECQIYTDVDGVYTTDPRMVPQARRMSRVTFEEMLELSSLGAKVLQIRSVEFAGKYNVPLRVLSTFVEGPGTLISYEEKGMEQPIVSGIAFSRDEAKFTIREIPDLPGVASKILTPVSDADIEVDMIIQNLPKDGLTDFTFTVHRRDFEKTQKILKTVVENLRATSLISDQSIAKVSLVGVGMRSHAGIASTMFDVLGKEGINIQLISTSEIKISVVMDEKYLELGVRTLHAAFALHEDPVEEVRVK